jgi:6-phosphogluconolactonase
MTPHVVVHPDPASGGRAVAERLGRLAQAALQARGRFVLGLSGGESPEPLFRALADASPASQRRWWLLWCDERLVPADDPRSNYGLARRLWLEPSHFPTERTLPVPTDGGPETSARRYDAELRRSFRAGSPAGPGPAAFDAVVLGLGPDGHTASLFPGAATLTVVDRWAVAVADPALPPIVPRVSLTLSALNRARVALFLVWGRAKREVLARALGESEREPTAGGLPAGRVRALESVEWYVDGEAWPCSAPAPSASKGA